MQPRYARACPRRLCAGWCDNDPAKHKLLCETSWEHFGNDWNHTCSRPELWLGGKVDPWLRDPVSGAIVGIEAEPVPPPLRVKVPTACITVGAMSLLNQEAMKQLIPPSTTTGAWVPGPHPERARPG